MLKKIALLFVVVLFGGTFLFRHVLIASLFEFAIGDMEYETRFWDEGTLVYKNLRVGSDLLVEQAEIKMHLSLSPIYLEPHVLLSSPHLTLQEGEVSGSPFSLLVPHRFFGVKLEAQDGVLEFRRKEQGAYFSWSFQDNLLSLNDEQGDFLTCALEQGSEGLSFECDIIKRPVATLVELFSLFFPQEVESLSQLEGEAEIHAKIDFAKDFSFSKISTVVEGSLMHGEKSFPLDFLMQGRVHEDNSFWIEGSANLEGSSLNYSFCRSEEKIFVIQGEFSEWGQEASFVFSSISGMQIPKGTFSGKGTAWIEENRLKRLCWEKVEAKDLYFEQEAVQAFASYLVCDGEWAEETFRRFSIALSDGHLRQDKWNATHLDLQLLFEDHLFKKCSASGLIQDLPINFFWSGAVEEADLQGEIEVLPEMKFAIESKWKKEKENWHLSGTAKREEDLVAFGLTFLPNFSFNDGWLHSDNVAIASYVPNLEGKLQIFAHFDENKIEGQVWSQGLTIHHEMATMTIPPQEKEARFFYPFSGGWSLEMPMQGVTLDHGFLVEEIEGILHLNAQEGGVDWRMTSHITKASLPTYFVHNLQFDLDFDSSAALFVFTHAQGDVQDYTFFCDDFRYFEKEIFQFDFLLRKDREEVAKAEKVVARFKGGAFDVEGEGLFLGKKAITPFQLKGKQLHDEWLIEKGEIGDLFVQGSFSKAELRWNKYTIQGNLKWVENGLSVQLSSIEGLPYPGRGEGRSLVTFFPEPKVQNISLVFSEDKKDIAHLKTDLLAYHSPSKKWQAEEVHISVDKGLEPFKGVVQLKLAPFYVSFQGVLQQGMMGELRPKQLFGLYEAPFLNMKCQAEYKDLPLQMVIRMNTDKEFAGTVQISEPQKEEGLTLTLASKGSIEKIEGSLRGIEAHLDKENAFYRGSVKILDGQAASIFYEPLQKIKGIEVSGLWKKEGEVFSFEGKLAGKDFEYSDRKFKEISADIQFIPNLAFIKNLSLFDEMLSLSIKQIRCDKSKESWIFEAPLVKAQNIRPSSKKPFHIRHLILSDLHGVLGDPSTYRGSGSFNFTNAPKREESLFEIPKEILKDLGLDLNFLTPARGEVEYQLKGGKIYLTALKNTFSEGSRSQFYLPADAPPSTIDLEGNLHIFLRLRQETALKWAEAFTLSVEGDFSQPKYSLK